MNQDKKKSRLSRDLPVKLEQLPNVGPAIAKKLRRLGIKRPADLEERDPYQLYDELCRLEGKHIDFCLLDVFLAAVDFVEGGPVRPWWKYTASRKRELARRSRMEH